MLTYDFTKIGSDSLYEYLYKCMKHDINCGVLKAGERLPSKRIFAKNLGISVITVENAYGQLMAEGYIYSIPKKGFYVSRLTGIVSGEKKGEGERLVLRRQDNALIADFSNNQTDIEVFPFSIWTKTMREIMNESQKQLMTNPPCGGIMELRTNISKYLQAFRGMNVNPEQIIIGAGTEYLYGLLIQLIGNQVTYGVENPGYHRIAKIYQSMQVSYEYVSLDEEGVSAEQLEARKIGVIHISPSHHFPTGKVMPVSRRYELLGWASRSHERYIIEDDYDSELRLTGKPIPTLHSIDVSDKVIYINTFTKTLCSTVRISYMVLPETLARTFYQKLSFYSCTVSNFEQYTLARFMENGSFEKHINRLRNYYQKKRDVILKAFREASIGKHVTIMEEEAGVHFLMKIESAKKEQDIVESAKENGIRLSPLSWYYYGENEQYENIYVMNYSSIDMEKSQEIAGLLYKSII